MVDENFKVFIQACKAVCKLNHTVSREHENLTVIKLKEVILHELLKDELLFSKRNW
jgi:hypothetical protein